MASREGPAMWHGESLYRSAKEKQVSGRRRNGENEPFFVEEMPASPVMRGRNNKRRNSVEEPFIGDDGGSGGVAAAAAVPTARGAGSGGAPVRGSGVTAETARATTADKRNVDTRADDATPSWHSNRGADSSRKTMRRTWRIIDDGVDDGNRRDEPSDKEDGPPSYESSGPPNQIGCSLDPSEIPSAAGSGSSIAARDNHEQLMVAFAYSPTTPTSPPIQLSPQAETYLWMGSPDSRSSLVALPSQSPSSDRLRPAYYTYQQQRAVQIVSGTAMTLGRDYENEQDFSDKPYNEFSHKYGGIVIAIFFIIFMMVLSLAVKFLIGNSFS